MIFIAHVSPLFLLPSAILIWLDKDELLKQYYAIESLSFFTIVVALEAA